MRPAAAGRVIEPALGGSIYVKCETAGQPVGDPVGEFEQVVGGGVEIRLVLFEPEHLGRHPLGIGAGQAVAQGIVAGGKDAAGLLAGAHVHPEKGAAQGAAVRRHRHQGAGGGVGGDAQDIGAGDVGSLQTVAHGPDEPLPPVVRILLGPGGAGKVGGIAAHADGDAAAARSKRPALMASVPASMART